MYKMKHHNNDNVVSNNNSNNSNKNKAMNRRIVSLTTVLTAILTFGGILYLSYSKPTEQSLVDNYATESDNNGNPTKDINNGGPGESSRSRSSGSSGIFLRADPEGVVLDDIQAYRSNLLIKRKYEQADLKVRTVHLNVNKSDVLVMLHIQKTGGTTFENQLVLHTDINPPCQCSHTYGNRLMCHCWNNKGQDWLFNRHAAGWMCGVHADFTELTTCVDQWFKSQDNEKRKRDYHYMTLVRDPVNRMLSEWQHVRRGATWKECRLHCDGRDASLEEVPFCFTNGNWSKVTFEDFLKCPHNMAFNRQTRMLANLSLSDCYRLHSKKTSYQRNEIMLNSAKENLRKRFKFFCILEYSTECQELFERTFQGLKFTKNINSKKGSLGMNYVLLSEASWNRIIQLNYLDIRLYQFAKDLFFQKLKRAGISLVKKDHECQYVNEGFTYSTVEV